MPDITMCQQKSCIKSENCYRKQAKPDSYQSYALFDCSEENGYEFFYLIEKENK